MYFRFGSKLGNPNRTKTVENRHIFNKKEKREAGASRFTLIILILKALVVQFQNCHESFLRNFYFTNLAHAFFTFFLFFQQLAFT